MSSVHKTTLELEKRFEQIQSDIATSESSIGRNLFSTGSSDVGGQMLDEFKSLEEQKDSLQSDIEQIYSLAKERDEFSKEAESLKKQGGTLAAGWQVLYEKLGSALADAPDVSYSNEFEPFRQTITELRQKAMEAKTALDSLREQMENQSFMNRLLTQVQYTAKNTSVSQLNKKLAQSYCKCGRDVFSTGVLEKLYEDGQLNAEVAAAFASCAELKRRVDENNDALSECNARLNEKGRQLVDKGITGSVERRVHAIEQEIQQKNARQQVLCQTSGHDFSLKYVDPDGEELLPFGDLDKDIVSSLKQISTLRQNSVICRRKIQIISLTEKIESANKRIDSLRHGISDNEEKIARLNAHNKEMQADITAVESEREQLVARRSELEIADAESTKRLESGSF